MEPTPASPPARRHAPAAPSGRDVALAVAVFAVELALSTEASKLEGRAWLGAVALVAVFPVASLWRRPRPLVVYGVAWVVTLVGGFLLDAAYQPFLPLLVALFTVAATLPLRTALEALGGAVVPLAALVAHRRTLENLSVAQTVAFAAFYALIYAVVWAAGWRANRHQREVAELEEARREAVEIEQRRLARELHDVVSHAVSVMVLQAAGAKAVFAERPEQVAAALDNIESSGRAAMSELRRMLAVLRAGGAADPEEDRRGLHEIDQVVTSVRSAGLDVAVEVEGAEGRLDPSVDHTAYRLVQEALTNALRHGGEHEQAVVRIDWRNGLVIEVSNRGGGRASAAGDLSAGYGLLGLHERVSMVGGEFEAGAGHDHRFRVRARLPTEKQGAAAME